MEEFEDCSICMKPIISDMVVLDCTHIFHEPCLRLWYNENKTCPLCRACICYFFRKSKVENFSKMGLTDLTFLKHDMFTHIKHLHLAKNNIQDISILEKLEFLETLDISKNFIADYSILQNLNFLKNISLDGNHLESIQGIPFESLIINNPTTNLYHLNIDKLSKLVITDSDNEIDLSYISYMKNLKVLIIDNIPNTDFSFLKTLFHLNELRINKTQLADIEFTRYLTKLISLNLKQNYIINITYLKDLDLIKLDISNNMIEDISTLSEIDSLKKLNIKGNNITNINVDKILAILLHVIS